MAKALPFHQINLDKCALDERIRKDLVDYIHCRVETSHRIQDNITPVVPHLANKFLPEPSPQDRFVLYLTETSGGSFLFAKLILDLIERYRLSSFKGRGTKLARFFAKNQYTVFPQTILFLIWNKDREAFRTLVVSLVQMTSFISRIFLKLVELQFKVPVSAEITRFIL